MGILRSLLKGFTCSLIIGFGVASTAFGDSCSDPLRQQEVCREMKHLRSQTLILGAQRDLMQINYDLLATLGLEIKNTADRALRKLKVDDNRHAAGLIGVQAIALDLMEQATQKNGDSFLTANKIQQQCSTCHSSSSATSGHRWEEIFKTDWSTIYQKCNSADRNPYRCKSMHAIFSYYSSFFTAYQLGLQNYELTGMLAWEIAKLSTMLKDNGLTHGLEDSMAGVAVESQVIAQMAAERKPEVFDRAMALTQSCMACHADRGMNLSQASLVRVKPWSLTK
jgi:cytochrome c553